MDVERGTVAGCMLLAITALIFVRTAPPALRTPRAIVDAGVDAARRSADRGIGSIAQPSGQGSVAPRRPASALADLIGRGGRRCDTILSVERIHRGEGLFRVLCRTGEDAVRYDVDARRGTVSATV